MVAGPFHLGAASTRRRAWALAFVATAILAAAICAAAGPARPVSPPAGHLIVAMALDGDSDVYALSSDVTRLAALTSNHTSDGALLSADRKALLVGPGAGPAGLRLVDPTGKPVGPAVTGGLSGASVPSLDGSWLLSRELLARTDGTARRPLGIPWNGPPATAWAPDSSAFVAEFPNRLAVYAVAHPASPRVVVRVAATGVAWSPDSRLLAYTDGRGGIWSVDAHRAGARPHLVVRVASNPTLSNPRWSTDGRWLSYVGASNALGLVRSTGGTPTRLTKDGLDAVWSPRGAQIAYRQITTESTRAGIVVATPGAAPRRIADILDDNYQLVWSPDGSALAFDDAHGITVVDVATRTSWHTVLLDPSAELVGWRNAPFPDTARRVALRPSERLVGGELRFPSKVRTIAAEGQRVAALVAGIGNDRGYVVLWTPPLPPVRLTFYAGLNGGGEEWLGIGMSSQDVLWQSAYCGNDCYLGFGGVTLDGRVEFWEEADIGGMDEADPYRDIFRIGYGPRGEGATVVYSNLDGSVVARTCSAPARCTRRDMAPRAGRSEGTVPSVHAWSGLPGVRRDCSPA